MTAHPILATARLHCRCALTYSHRPGRAAVAGPLTPPCTWRVRRASTQPFPHPPSTPAPDRSTKAVVACRDPSQCSPSDILSLVSPATDGSGRGPTSALLLLSRSLAAWLSPDDAFLAGFVASIAPPASSPQLSLLAAVVDRLPSPSAQSSLEAPLTPRKDHGLDGLAYYATASQHLFGSLSENVRAGPITANSSRPDVATSSESPPCLSFELYDHVSPGAGNPVVHSTVTVPLANTVFETGQPATAVFSQWLSSSGRWEMTSKHHVAYENQPVALHAHTSRRIDRALSAGNGQTDEAPSHSTRLALPLDPLVPARRIENARGNIITKVSDAESDEGVQPASKELETAVSDYFLSRNMDASVMAVWCLVIPKAVAERQADMVARAQRLWQDGASTERVHLSNRYIAALVWSGATLHKVLSGGGGWGQKAGLLSIDPESDYVEKKASIPSFLASLQGEGEASIYPDVTARGDLIAFFAAPESADMFVDGKGATSGADEVASLDFGVLPSTMDGDRYAARDDDGHDTTDFEVHPEHFGALSEGGMSVATAAEGAGSSEMAVRSKVDVPFARFSYQCAMR